MGCSASRPANFISPNQNPTSNSSPSLSNSPYHSFSSTPVSRTLSLATPLVHHPPLRKGDSNHFVSLTSTTYGSLVLIDPPTSDAEKSPENPPQDLSGGSEEPLSPDSVINTWELMEGLDDDESQSQFHMVEKVSPIEEMEIETEISRSYEIVSKPLWKHLSEESNVVSLCRESVCENATPISISKPGNKSCEEDRIILYFTSLRGIRKTYEDCCSVRVILNGFGVCVDERDISMDRSYRMELQEALKGKSVSLPQVFIKGKHIGGADEIKQLNEDGKLTTLLVNFPVKDSGFVCERCGDARFLPCPNCNGSRKVYEGKLTRCPHCNENGLIRCFSCCS